MKKLSLHILSVWRLNILKIKDFDLSPEIWEQKINQHIYGKNAERDRDILVQHIIYGETYERLADEYGLSVNGVKKIVYKRYAKVLKHI